MTFYTGGKSSVNFKEIFSLKMVAQLVESTRNVGWLDVQASLKGNFGEDVYCAWLSKINLFSATEHEIILSVPTDFIKDWIKREYFNGIQKTVNGQKTWIRKGIKEVILDLYPKVNSIDIIVDRTREVITPDVTEKDVIGKYSEEKEDNIKSFSENGNLYNVGIDLNNKYTFENFVVGASNKLAYSVAKSIANSVNIDVDTNPLFLYGGVGLGKTHLCQAIAWQMKDNFPNKNIVYLTAERFMYLFVQSLQSQNVSSFKDRFRNIDVLIIDDIHFIAGKDSTQKEFFQTFNTLIGENKQIILACDKSPLNLEKVDEQLKSRMSGGIVVDVLEPDYQLRFDIVKFKSKQMGLELDDKTSKFIAEKIVSSGREIEGCLKRLLMHQKFMNVKITQKVIEEVLADNITQSQKVITIDDILEKVSSFYKVSLSELKSDKRLKELVIPRHIAMYLCKKLTSKSFPDIAKKFGGKNHATVIHAIKKVDEMIENDQEISDNISKIKNLLNS